jgi:hypothetical protein
MNSPALPLNRLVAICDFLEMPLADLLQAVRRHHSEEFHFTREQEEFFASHPHFLAYFFAVIENSPAEIERIHGISRKSTFIYLSKLESMGLLELHPGDKVKHRVRGPVVWSDHGILGQTNSRIYVLEFAAHAAGKIAKPERMILELQGWRLTPEEFEEYKREYRQLADRYREISSFNKRVRPKNGVLTIAAMLLADEWDPPHHRAIKEIAAVKL